MTSRFSRTLLVAIPLGLWLNVVTCPAAAEVLRITVVDTASGETVTDAVVELVALDGTAPPAAPREAVVDQRDKEFVPPVTVVPVGSRVAFPNSDDILHHVYSFSPAKTFDIPLYGRNDNAGYSQVFDSPGVVEIGCNIHDWMLAYIYVSDAHHAQVSDPAGQVEFLDVAPGTYRLQVWHSRLDAEMPVQRDMRIEAGADQTLSVSVELGRDRRLRRAPST
ncbi:MAG: hypothetical protein RLZZ385_651, partial [Pseudomonadota bacterium]